MILFCRRKIFLKRPGPTNTGQVDKKSSESEQVTTTTTNSDASGDQTITTRSRETSFNSSKSDLDVSVSQKDLFGEEDPDETSLYIFILSPHSTSMLMSSV